MSILTKPIAEKRYLTFPEVRAAYGIGRKTIAKFVRERQLRRRMVGKAWRYPVADLEAAEDRVGFDKERSDEVRNTMCCVEPTGEGSGRFLF